MRLRHYRYPEIPETDIPVFGGICLGHHAGAGDGAQTIK